MSVSIHCELLNSLGEIFAFICLQYVCHAEMNAILNKNSTDVKGCTIYVALFPCNECAKLIIQVLTLANGHSVAGNSI